VTAGRVTNLDDLMDSAYDAPKIRAQNPKPGGKAEMEAEARGRRHARYKLAQDVRYNERGAAERVNARLKDEFGVRNVRVRRHAEVMCHLMFGIVALTIDQIMRLVT
jgi:hypothetical protein